MPKTNKEYCKQYQLEQHAIGTDFITNSLQPLLMHFVGQLQLSTPTNSNEDYGGHHKTLNYPKETIQSVIHQQKSSFSKKVKLSSNQRYSLWLDGKTHDPSGKLIIPDGSKSFGLVRDKESKNDPDRMGVPCNSNSPNRLSFLQQLKSSILSTGRLNTRLISGLKEEHFETLRMNIVKGACTLKHTDVLRSSLLPNYCYFLSPYQHKETTFELVIQTWPHFKTSVVWYKNKLCVPFEYNEGAKDEDFNYKEKKGGYLYMITLDNNNKASWLVLEPSQINELKPYYKLKDGFAIAGVKNGMVYYLSKKYKIYDEWNQVPLVSLVQIFENLQEDGTIDKPSRKRFLKKSEFNTIHKFNGWEHIHSCNYDKSDLSTIRVHIFFRNIRTVGVCQHPH